MTTETAQTNSVTFTRRERSVLLALRNRYHKDQDRFSNGERARLEFVRWLVENDRMQS